MRVLVFLMCAWACQGGEFLDKTDRYLIACHTTDFTCFKRQFLALRDFVLMGNPRFAIDQLEPYSVQYGNSCVRLSGWEESELVGIGMDGEDKVLTLALQLPVRMQQVQKGRCAPQQGFTDVSTYNEDNSTLLMEFTANATVTVVYPYTLLRRKGSVYLILGEEDLDALVDIPVYELEGSEAEAAELNKASEWAYGVVQSVDAAQEFALPFTSRLRLALLRIPFRRLMLLYPEEKYTNLQFAFLDIDI